MSEPVDQPTAPPGQAEPPLASWGQRLGALLADNAPIVALLVVMTFLFGESETVSEDGAVSASFQLTGIPFAVYTLVALVWFGYNWVWRQGTTGQTHGKSALGIAVHEAGTTEPLGPGLSFARQLLHLLDAVPCFLGFLWPLWDRENRTFADMVIGSRVHQT